MYIVYIMTTPQISNTKEELITKVKDWIRIDTEIAKLRSEIRLREKTKKNLTQCLVNVMKLNKIDDFNINGGKLVYKQTKTKKTITGKTLLTTLQNYYKDNPQIAEELTKHVLDNRDVVVKETIQRKIIKPKPAVESIVTKV